MLEENKENIKKSDKALVVFKPTHGKTEYQVILDENQETLWATEIQIAEIFGRDRTVINRHIKNSYKEGELDENSTSAKIAQVRKEGDREIEREVKHYNLDVIISVGYRVKSPLATEFRKWATNKLKEYLLKGYTINEQLLQESTKQIKELKTEINLLNEIAFKNQLQLTDGFLSIISHYSKSFELLNKYDTQDLTMDNLTDEIIYTINYKDVKSAIEQLKKNLISKGEAGELFGNEKDKSFEGILGSISQTVFGELAYPTAEEQAAQLLYSIIKGHAFSDGNKRIGSFVFVWFLERNNIHLTKEGERKISENSLVSLALAVAQSSPEQRDTIIKLIVNLIKN
ncbi:virulence protein RhuM/Fic/DOC family protein [Hanstruepera flava]|uniref:virulence protein RhuM/Fic/DOC family protein n=1 Tax=Hanstruepera flava TaxID=2930218 RepID=UPI002028B5BB|nr:virulence protein RhuM/Fic/DOC family protein [Hanstruepera flava]